MHITKGTIVTAVRQGLEDKCEVVGQGLLASLNSYRLTVARACDGAVAGHTTLMS